MVDRAMMALFDERHRLKLPSGYSLEKTNENSWEVLGPVGDGADIYLAFHIAGNVPVGRGGSMDHEIKRFAEAMNVVLVQTKARGRAMSHDDARQQPEWKPLGSVLSDAVPDDVRRLVIAARRAFDLGYGDEEFHKLDAALEPFASRVPYDSPE